MSIFEETQTIGGRDGTGFHKDRISQRQVIKKLEVWSKENGLSAIDITYSDGTVETAGKSKDNHEGSFEIDYGNGERVTEIQIFGLRNYKVFKIEIKTNKARSFNPGSSSEGQLRLIFAFNPEMFVNYKQPVGSGIIIGMYGRHGETINALGFKMLRKINSLTITNVEYDMQGLNLNPPRPVSSLDVTLANASKNPTDAGYKKVTKERSESGSWSVTAGLTFGASATVKAKIPLVAEVAAETHWELSASTTHEKSWTNTSGTEISIPLVAPAQRKTRITVSYYEAILEKLPFKAQIKFSLENGSKFYTDVKGTYDGVSNSRFIQDSKTVARWNETTDQWEDV